MLSNTDPSFARRYLRQVQVFLRAVGSKEKFAFVCRSPMDHHDRNSRKRRFIRDQKSSVDVPTKVFTRFFRIQVAVNALLDFFDGKIPAGERVRKILVILEVHVINNLIAESNIIIDCRKEFLHRLCAHVSFRQCLVQLWRSKQPLIRRECRNP